MCLSSFSSVYNTEIGYTQGMNQIVAFLLFYLPEEEAFWAFCQLMTGSRWTMHGFFCPGFPKLFRFQAQFEKIMKKMLPKVYKHFHNNQVQNELYTIRWFMLCYLGRTHVRRHSRTRNLDTSLVCPFRLPSVSVDTAYLGRLCLGWRASPADNSLLYITYSSQEAAAFEILRKHQFVPEERTVREFRQFVVDIRRDHGRIHRLLREIEAEQSVDLAASDRERTTDETVQYFNG